MDMKNAFEWVQLDTIEKKKDFDEISEDLARYRSENNFIELSKWLRSAEKAFIHLDPVRN